MARTQEEIVNDILSSISSNPNLSPELTSLSKTALFRLMADTFAEAGHSLEVSFDNFQDELERVLLNQRVGSEPFYIEKALAFQYGDSVVEQGGGKFGYAVIDETKQIIKRSSVNSSEGIVLLKVAKEDLSGNPIPLDSVELNALRSYFGKVDFTPSFLQYISSDGDDLQITFTATLDPQVFNISTGERISDGVKAVEVAIVEYSETFDLENFNGTFYVSQLIDKITDIAGVVNITIDVCEAKSDTEVSYTNVLLETGKKYNTYAGYFKTPVLTPNYN